MCQWFSNLGEFRVDSTQHTQTHTRAHTQRSVKYETIRGNPSLASVWTEPEEPKISASLNVASAARSVRIPCRKTSSKRWGLGEHHGWTWRDVTQQQQGGKPLYDDQIQAVGRGALDQWTRSSSSREPGWASAVQSGRKRTDAAC